VISANGVNVGTDDYAPHITDFTAGEAGDQLDIAALLEYSASIGGYVGGNPFSEINGYLQLTQDGDDALLRYDRDGAAGVAYGFVTVARLAGVNVEAFTDDNFAPAIPPTGESVPGKNVTGTSAGQKMAGGFFTDTLSGLGGDDSIKGGGDSDQIDGGEGNDELEGQSGNDTILGGNGSDVIFGGAGDDSIDGGADSDTIQGDAGNDVIAGGAGGGRFLGNEGDDTLTGGDNIDTLWGGAGADSMMAGLGNDWLFACDDDSGDSDFSNDTLYGGGGSDHMYAQGGDDFLSGDAGNDFLYSYGNGNEDTLLGGAGSDYLLLSRSAIGYGGADNDELSVSAYSTGYGEDGDDILRLFQGSSTFGIASGGAGSDRFVISANGVNVGTDDYAPHITDFTAGEAGDQLDINALLTQSANVGGYVGGNPFEQSNGYLLLTQDGDDALLRYDRDGAAGGTDSFVTVARLLGVDANAVVEENFAGVRLVGGNASDNLEGGWTADTLIGGGGSDKLDGDLGGDTLDGGSGNDSIVGGAGDDTITGGTGIDTVKYNGTVAVIVNLQTGVASGEGLGSDVLSSIENVVGGQVADWITGSDGSNRFDGGAGADKLVGGAGNDTLAGGTGGDTLTGGAGNDVFRFDTKAKVGEADRIVGFTHNTDKIEVMHDAFLALPKGALAADAFHAAAGATKAHDGSDRIIFDTTTGTLYYDADGHGGAAAIKLAVLGAGVTLSAADFKIG
jgi:Ca2+-binding RTX toxin-like protein